MKRLTIAMIFVLAVGLTSCAGRQGISLDGTTIGGKFDPEIAEDILGQTNAVIGKALKQNAAKCQAVPNLKTCNILASARHGHNLAVEALNAYCAGPDWAEDGPCNPPDNEEFREHLASRFTVALERLAPIIEAVEGLIR